MKFNILMALLGVALAEDFPAYDPYHAYCEIDQIESQSSCDDTMTAISRIFNVSTTKDPVVDFANPPGLYIKKTPPVETKSMVWGKRL